MGGGWIFGGGSSIRKGCQVKLSLSCWVRGGKWGSSYTVNRVPFANLAATHLTPGKNRRRDGPPGSRARGYQPHGMNKVHGPRV